MLTRRFAWLLVVAVAGCRARARTDGDKSTTVAPTLADARRGFTTHVTDHLPKEGPAPAPPKGVFDLVRYSTPGGDLPAYVTPRPDGGKRLPAIVWVQGGFDPSVDESAWSAATSDNDQTAQAFRKAGVVLMLPARRGGNDDPRPRESFFGEVDDVIAAADYVAKLDYVDPARVYLGGHSTGGTLALLVAESTDRFRGVFSFGPVANIKNYGKELTFDVSNANEVRLRSPMYFLSAIHTPTFVFEGAKSPSNADQLPFLTPKSTTVPVHTYRVPGVSHFSILAPVSALLARKIMSGETIEISDKELAGAVGG